MFKYIFASGLSNIKFFKLLQKVAMLRDWEDDETEEIGEELEDATKITNKIVKVVNSSLMLDIYI